MNASSTSEMTLSSVMEMRLEMLLSEDSNMPNLKYRSGDESKDAALYTVFEMIVQVGSQLPSLLEIFAKENGSLTEDLILGAGRISNTCSSLSYERILNSDFAYLEEILETCVPELATPSQGELLRVHDATELWLQTQNCFLQIQSFYEKYVTD